MLQHDETSFGFVPLKYSRTRAYGAVVGIIVQGGER